MSLARCRAGQSFSLSVSFLDVDIIASSFVEFASETNDGTRKGHPPTRASVHERLPRFSDWLWPALSHPKYKTR
jgi:hypothetical protein